MDGRTMDERAMGKAMARRLALELTEKYFDSGTTIEAYRAMLDGITEALEGLVGYMAEQYGERVDE